MIFQLTKKCFTVYCAYKFYQYQQDTNCCGIIGYLGKDNIANEVLSQGINLLQNRGYDSSGIAIIKDGKMNISKMTSDFVKGIDCIEEIQKILKQQYQKTNIGIGHTRWATCGQINDLNAHPHTDNKDRIAIVHNGTIYNYELLKNELQNKGYKFKSQTDTEVIAILIGYFLDQQNDLMTAVKLTCEKLDGTWGLLILHKDYPEQIICGRKGSPLLIGFGQNALFISSEPIAFHKYTNEFIRLEDREIILLSLDKSVKESVKERMITYDAIEIKDQPSEGYRCFFEEEIFEQPLAIKKALGFFNRLILHRGVPKLGGFDRNSNKALNIDNMVLIGCGSSYNAALYGRHLFNIFEVFNTCICIEASDFSQFDLPKKQVGVICLTQSGETADVINACKIIKKINSIPIIGITNVVGSLITTLCDFGVFQNSGREIAVAASKSFTTQIVVLYLIVLWYSYHKQQHKYKFERTIAIQIFSSLPSLVQLSLDQNKDKIKELALQIKDIENLFIIAKGSSFPFAREMALKIKELCYIHAEAFPAGELKHGPLALINSTYKETNTKQTILIIIVLDNKHLDHLCVTISEVKSRKAYVICITDCKEKLLNLDIDFIIEIPHCKPFGPLLTIFPGQQITNELSLIKGINPDKPRNLAKTVTVI